MNCPSCQHENRSKALFCSSCGKKLVTDVEPTYDKHVKKVSIFFFTLLIYIAILRFSEYVTDFKSIIISDVIFALIITVFFFINYSKVKPLITFRTLKPLAIGLVLISAFVAAFLVSRLGEFMNKSLFDRTEIAYYQYYSDSPNPLLFTILSVGVMPAIFEEIAFRGILFSELQMITTTPAVILITSMLFTILHFSFLSVIWLFPGALLLGYLRAKYNTISYGMLAHFTYNTSIVLLQYFLFK